MGCGVGWVREVGALVRMDETDVIFGGNEEIWRYQRCSRLHETGVRDSDDGERTKQVMDKHNQLLPSISPFGGWFCYQLSCQLPPQGLVVFLCGKAHTKVFKPGGIESSPAPVENPYHTIIIKEDVTHVQIVVCENQWIHLEACTAHATLLSKTEFPIKVFCNMTLPITPFCKHVCVMAMHAFGCQ